jgi:hypothetical protein
MIRELKFAFEHIRRFPDNDAAWGYALGWVEVLPPGYDVTATEEALVACRDWLLEACEGKLCPQLSLTVLSRSGWPVLVIDW